MAHARLQLLVAGAGRPRSLLARPCFQVPHPARSPGPPTFRSGAADWYWALPPMTRGLLTCYLVTGLAAFMGVLPLKHLYMDWRLVFRIRALPQVLWTAGCG